MKSGLIIAAGLLSMPGACAGGPYEGTPAHHTGGYNKGYGQTNGYYNSTYYDGRYNDDAHNRAYNFSRTYQ